MKQLWLTKEECTGCGLCENICPQRAITMEIDRCGFIYPSIHLNCIDCNLCQIKCDERLRIVNKNEKKPKTFAAWSMDDVIRFRSTSGGAFSELGSTLLQDGGYVVGAEYADDNTVHHAVINSIEGLDRLRQSKYVQSNPGLIYKQVKDLLSKDNAVVFCGAPCQVAALYVYLGNKYDKLFTIDFICRGMNSPKAYLSWLSEIERKEKKKIVKVWFKYKDAGWKASPTTTRLDFSDGTYSVVRQNQNLFMTGYLTKNLYIRPSCGCCQFKGVPRNSDITLADFWGVDSDLDDDKGTSLMLINNRHGMTLLEKCKEKMHIHERDFSEIFRGNICFSSSVEVPQNGEQFLLSLDKYTFSKALSKFSGNKQRNTIFSKPKRFIGRIISKIIVLSNRRNR